MSLPSDSLSKPARRKRRIGLMREASTLLAIVVLLVMWAVIAVHG